MPAVYDTIGKGYSSLRQPDRRLAAQIRAALGEVKSVVNVGAGTGSYEPQDCAVTAVEPSAEMIRQRPFDAAPAVQAEAGDLPFCDNAFDAGLAILTVHHWPDKAQGLSELRRVVSGRIVIVTFDPSHEGNWLDEYLPSLRKLDAEQMPAMESYAATLGPVDIRPLLVPHDCADGFLYAYWRRPEAYLDPAIRAGSSSFHKLTDLAEGLSRLECDLADGTWHSRHAALLDREEMDLGYRLVITR